mgnify:CR=1 FL=1
MTNEHTDAELRDAYTVTVHLTQLELHALINASNDTLAKLGDVSRAVANHQEVMAQVSCSSEVLSRVKEYLQDASELFATPVYASTRQ